MGETERIKTKGPSTVLGPFANCFYKDQVPVFTLRLGHPCHINNRSWTKRVIVSCSTTSVKGQSELPSGGHETCPLTVTRTARWWPWDLPMGAGGHHRPGAQANGLTPWPASAWVSRTESPLVWHTWAW